MAINFTGTFRIEKLTDKSLTLRQGTNALDYHWKCPPASYAASVADELQLLYILVFLSTT